MLHGYAVSRKTLLTLDAGHYHPTEGIADKISSVLQFVPEILLHVSRGVRWDSDHVVTLTDELQAIAREIVTNGFTDRVHIGTSVLVLPPAAENPRRCCAYPRLASAVAGVLRRPGAERITKGGSGLQDAHAAGFASPRTPYGSPRAARARPGNGGCASAVPGLPAP